MNGVDGAIKYFPENATVYGCFNPSYNLPIILTVWPISVNDKRKDAYWSQGQHDIKN